MTELLDAFQDAGVDQETVAFLVEALQHAEPDEWSAVLEPFVPAGPVVAVLNTVPSVLVRTAAVLERAAVEAAAKASKPPPNTDSHLLDAFILFGLEHLGACGPEEEARSSVHHLPGALGYVDVHALARCERLCRRASSLVATPGVWEPRVRAACDAWALPCPEEGGSWRRRFFELPRPRLDGIYVGECRYVHQIRPGSNFDLRPINRSFHWVEYQRCLRLLPRDPVDGAQHALVLRAHVPLRAAAETLLNVDPKTHVNCLQPEKPLEQRPHISAQASLAQLVAAGTYELDGDRVQVRFANCGDRYSMVFQLGDGTGRPLSRPLEWVDYHMTSRAEETVPFNLGRSVYGGGEPADAEKDHFPPLRHRPCRELEHLL